MAEFSNPVAAVRSAFDIQRDLVLNRRDDPNALKLRMGVHLADVVINDDDLLGDGVNIAARVEAAADPDSVAISAPVFEQERRTALLTFEDLGPADLKNIPELPYLTRRAAAYGAASAVECEGEIKNAVQTLLRVGPSFNVREFISTEFYRDPSIANRLSALLRSAGLTE